MPYAPDAAPLTKSLLPSAVVAGFLRMDPLPNINLILSSLLSASEIPLAALNMYGDGGKNLRTSTGKNEMTCCDLSLISSLLLRRHGNRQMKRFDKIREGNSFKPAIWRVKFHGMNRINVLFKRWAA